MAVIVDTAAVAPHERFALWAQTSAEVFEPLDVRPRTDAPFSARLMRHRLGPLKVDHMRADASAATRTPALIRSRDPDEVKVMLQLRGTCSIEQDERAALVAPGQFTCWHSSHPYTVAGAEPFEVLIVHCPSQLLGAHLGDLGRRTAEPVDGSTRVGTMARGYLTGVLAGLDEGAFGAACEGHLAEGVLDLIRALYARAEAVQAPPSAGDALRRRVLAYIDAHLGDPELGPERIAGEHFISRSYLHKLFEGQAAGVSGTIKARRLERARRDLASPALAAEPVFRIASRWGFRSAAHFSRAFRAAYGCSPSELRERSLG
ncbi:MAG TPA: helix-turn-helix domain-containing protein [Solirubrobacteraceae bacterium]|jgi:AraC-like DNA-binding protein|nr:helix-turn-helix domain-containing protein [Solirubrobacteraceae bacterium]